MALRIAWQRAAAPPADIDILIAGEEDNTFFGKVTNYITNHPDTYPLATTALIGGIAATALSVPLWTGLATGAAFYVGTRAITACCRRRAAPRREAPRMPGMGVRRHLDADPRLRHRRLGPEGIVHGNGGLAGDEAMDAAFALSQGREYVPRRRRGFDEMDEKYPIEFEDGAGAAGVGFRPVAAEIELPECPIGMQPILPGQEIKINGILYDINFFVLGVLAMDNGARPVHPMTREDLTREQIGTIATHYGIIPGDFLELFNPDGGIAAIENTRAEHLIRQANALAPEAQVARVAEIQNEKSDRIRDARKQAFIELVRVNRGESSSPFQGLMLAGGAI